MDDNLNVQIEDAKNFITELGKGNLDAAPLNNKNILAGPIKELHSQLSALTLSMKQLSSGNVVGKLLYPGSIFKEFNSLIDNVAALSRHNAVGINDTDLNDENINSWRYHQLISAMNHLKIMIIEVSEDGAVLYANLPAKKYIGNITSFSENIPDCRNRTENKENKTPSLLEYLIHFSNIQNRQSKNISFPVYKEIYEKDNMWYKVTTEYVTFIDGTQGYMHVIDDISVWKKQETTLIYKAITDPLTKTYNRLAGMESLASIISFAKNDVTHCICFIDIDDLKQVNDQFGHMEGDRAVQSIANVLLTTVRENDIVSRYGGDEFMIVFNKCTKPSAEKALERMYKKIDILNESGAYPYFLSFSHGIVEIIPSEVSNIESVIDEVDKLMYENKTKKKAARHNTSNSSDLSDLSD